MMRPTIERVVMQGPALAAFLTTAFPDNPRTWTDIEPTERGLRLRLPFDRSQIRPGGTLSGPTLMNLADGGAYLAVLSRIGPVELAVTSDLTIHFLRKPAPTDVVGECELLRLGRRQAVVDVRMYSVGDARPVATSTVTYAIP